MHVSSLGEFEQGRPILERWKALFPGDKILLSFYSPSGFNIRKNYPLADLVFYLPLDTAHQMNRLLDQIQPDLFILVKYDFWPNLLKVLKERCIPSYLISACFRPDQYLFKKWGRYFLRQLQVFKWIFVQDDASLQLLERFNFQQVVVAGDTRVDAVMTNRMNVPGVRNHTEEERDGGIIIGGSTWPVEERMLAKVLNSQAFKNLKGNWSLVIAPHDISEEHLVRIEELFEGHIIRHSRIEGPWQNALPVHRVILIDSIGLLSSLYANARVAFIGGGFGKGIHNILEPAAYGIPVIFGPNSAKFREAEILTSIGGAFRITSFEEFSTTLIKICSDSHFRTESGNLAVNYMKSQMGSSELIIRYLLGK